MCKTWAGRRHKRAHERQSALSSSVLDLLAGEFLRVAQNQPCYELPLTQLVAGGCSRELETVGSICSGKYGREYQEKGRKKKTVWWLRADDIGQKSYENRFC